MIISCPECAGPFEVRDDQIAALVQVKCPGCAFRMILDFEAANDPSLVEDGMKMASGFRSAADYYAGHRPAPGPARPSESETPAPREAVAAAPEPVASPEPAASPEPETRPAARPAAASEARPARRPTPTPRPRATTRTGRPTASQPPGPAAPPIRRPASTPAPRSTGPSARPIPTPTPGKPPVRVAPSTTPAQPAARATEPREPYNPDRTLAAPGGVPMRPPGSEGSASDYAPPAAIPEPTVDLDDVPTGHEPDPIPRSDAPVAESAEPTTHRHPLAKPAHPPFGDDDEDMPTMVVPPEARRKHLLENQLASESESETESETESGRERHPPHTPPSLAKASISEDDAERTSPRRPPAAADAIAGQSDPHLSPSLEADELHEKSGGMSTLGVVVVVILLLLAIALVGASLALEGTADPRPLLESLYRQYVKG